MNERNCLMFWGRCICWMALIFLSHGFSPFGVSQYASQSVSSMAHLHLNLSGAYSIKCSHVVVFPWKRKDAYVINVNHDVINALEDGFHRFLCPVGWARKSLEEFGYMCPVDCPVVFYLAPLFEGEMTKMTINFVNDSPFTILILFVFNLFSSYV
mgnify:CR=1 FL=1